MLANDPDADRLAAAVPDPSGRGYRMLSGNEIGVLLADDALEHAETGGRPKLVVTTVVSSSLLSRMARDRGARYGETLTGFKWIADAAIRAEREGIAFVLGYEEALGYSVGPLVRDKDGIGAALRLAELTRHLEGPRRDAARPPRPAAGDPRPLAPGPVVGRRCRGRGPRAHRRRDGGAAQEPAAADRREPGRPPARRRERRGDAARRAAAVAACRRRTCWPSSRRTARGSPSARAAPSRRSSSTWSSSARRRTREAVAPARARLEAEGKTLKAALMRELKLA